jgi:hypothetical protein
MATTTTSSNQQANCYNAPTNVKMTLTEARNELESNGFVILDQHESEQLLQLSNSPSSSSSSKNNLLVARRSECKWCGSAKMDTLVFCQELVAEQGDILTVSRTQDDLQRLKTDWLLSLPRSFYSPSGCPPHGYGRGRIILMIYLTTQPISEHVARQLTQKPSAEWCQGVFLAAQDVNSSSGDVTSYYYSQETPCWGKALYPEMRYWAALLTGRRPMPPKPSPWSALNLCLIAAQIYCIAVLCYVYFYTLPLTMPSTYKFWYIALAIVLVLPFLVTIAYHECQARRYQRRGHTLATKSSSAVAMTIADESSPV